MKTRSLHAILIAKLIAPSFLGLMFLGGCSGDDGTLKPMELTPENKANIEAEKKADEEAKNRKSKPGEA